MYTGLSSRDELGQLQNQRLCIIHLIRFLWIEKEVRNVSGEIALISIDAPNILSGKKNDDSKRLRLC